jgi:hypothetical protein
VPASIVSKTQRRGRIGRVADGVCCCLTEVSSEESESLPYLEGLQVCLAAASLKVPWPPDSMNNLIQPEVQCDLHRMGLLTQADQGLDRTTSLGERMLCGHMDVTSNLLVTLAEALDIKDIGMIIAAYIGCKKDLFSDVFQSSREFGLSSCQVALGEDTGFPVSGDNLLSHTRGDVHTAVRWYLEWIVNGKVIPHKVRGLFRLACFQKMAMNAPRLTPEQAKKLLAIPHWRGALTVTIAFAYQRNIMPRYGAEGYKSTFDSKDPSRKVLDLPSAVPIQHLLVRCATQLHLHQVPGLSSLALPVFLTLSQ